MEKEPEYFFAYNASFRVVGDNLPFDEVETELQISATHKHRKGQQVWQEPTKFKDRKFTDDKWILESPLSEDENLDKHLKWLWDKLGSHKKYIVKLKNKYHLDIFAGYRSDCRHCGTVISSEAMRICHELDIPLELSIVVT